MTLRFFVRFSTSWGQQLSLALHTGSVLPMTWYDQDHWTIELEWDLPELRYHYIFTHGWDLPEQAERRLVLLPGEQELTIRDEWRQPGRVADSLMKAPFRDVYFYHSPENVERSASHYFQVSAPLLESGREVWLTGSVEALGNWDTTAAVKMRAREDGRFAADVNILPGEAVEYKYLLDGREYEAGENRSFHSSGPSLIDDNYARFNYQPWKGAGVAVPVFSLRSENGLGCGEFADLRLLADWAASTGQRLVQLLPVNDTIADHSWKDSYPYAAISAFALHPMYIHLPGLGKADGYAAMQSTLNALPDMDYETTIRFKTQALKTFYQSFKADETYGGWVNANRYWLEPYAVFCNARDNNNERGFYYFVQYHLHLQLSEAVAYAHSKGIAIKGDLPVGMYLHSADVSFMPELFDTTVQAGAPPDEFAEKGQNWGFPAYNWPIMEATGYSWWKQRLQHMAQYFSAFRIDHVLGFFRLWQIPRREKEGILGYFHPAKPLTEQEIFDWGIPFTHARYCEPYITDAVLYSIFSGDAVKVRSIYLEPAGDGHYRLRDVYRHQADITEEDPDIRQGLYDLIANVIFVEPSPGEFHPRFDLHRTASFLALDIAVQESLKQLSTHFFYHRHDELWEKEALRKLPVLQSATDMLVCGEDLGMVPHCVPGVLQRLGILSLEVLPMPKQAGQTPAQAPYLSVVTPSTHDMSTLRGYAPGNEEEIIRLHLQSPAMWCILQMQDWLALDTTLPQRTPEEERINVPAITPWYWRYRMPLTLETLCASQQLTEKMLAMVKEGGR
ncbi:4-alpha-glucanotransferase [Chitinophaga barathri]|uniref:4-alpha-glucanotransferase n=1 Tax=Chitinophaga barathri TaxID=1647451 RepID=A0A3N4MEJ9_9BACT|nr:4-alpha-glucanotransferase [Chitinophaga barathri]RPD42221.1 4-alpha-glucanotransferase [Chitinophaga barathri]